MSTPEAQARAQIDEQLFACGWIVQDYKKVDFTAGRGIALREVPLKTGPCDYLLLVDRHAVGVIEAKKEGTTLSVVAEQSDRYGSSLPEFLSAGLTGPLPFLYESTGLETFFRDARDPAPRSRRVFAFHRPETLGDWAAEPDTLRARLVAMPIAHPLVDAGNDGANQGLGASPMRDCQVEAITGLEKSFAENRPRALIHMATGAGKRTDLDDFVACYFGRAGAASTSAPKKRGEGATSLSNSRHNRVETDRFKSFTYDELIKRDKVNLDIFWLKDDALEDSANLPAPGIIAADIVADLEAALEQFAAIEEDLKTT